MHSLVWQSDASALHRSFKDKAITEDSRGGQIYEYYAVLAVSELCDVFIDPTTCHQSNESLLNYWLNLKRNRTRGKIFVKSQHAIHSKRKRMAIEIGMLHHIYLDQKKGSIKGRLEILSLMQSLRNMDEVVTVSKYWANYLRDLGCKNVTTIYNSFKLDRFLFSRDSIEEFLTEYKIPTDKPLVHIGYAEAAKGALDVYEILKDKDYTLVTTGPSDT